MQAFPLPRLRAAPASISEKDNGLAAGANLAYEPRNCLLTRGIGNGREAPGSGDRPKLLKKGYRSKV